jgi:hypothetical protein
MTTTTQVGSEPRTRTRRDRPHRSISDPHHLAVVQAEARTLAQALQPFGVLRKDQLKREARAAKWREGNFEVALQAAVEAGEIQPLPLDFYRKADPGENGGHAAPVADAAA